MYTSVYTDAMDTTQTPETPTVPTTRFFVATSQIANARKAVAKASKKAEKLGLPAATLTVVGEPILHAQRWSGDGTSFETGLMIEVVEVEVTCPEFTIPGYRLVASIDLDTDGNIVGKFPAYHDVELPAEWNTIGDTCDHCGFIRNRKSLIAIEEIETGDYKLVGKTCLAEYVGHVDAFEAMKAAEAMSKLYLTEGFYGSGGECDLGTVSFVGVAISAIRAFGWTAGGGTRDDCTRFCFNRKGREALIEAGMQVPTAADYATAEAMIAWVATDTSDSDYIRNLRIAAARKSCNKRTFGLLASLPSAYARAREWELKKAAERKAAEQDGSPSNWIGSVKERLEVTATVESVREFDGDYGVRVLVKARTESGDVIVWWTNESAAFRPFDWTTVSAKERLDILGVADTDSTSRYISEGLVLSGKATVKKLDEFRGEKQTVVTRWSCDMAVPALVSA